MAYSDAKDQYKDYCAVTKTMCPFYADEGMCVCKSKIKCLNYFQTVGSASLSELKNFIIMKRHPEEA